MALNSNLLSQFAKIVTSDNSNTSNKVSDNLQGTVVYYNDTPYVQLDGSDLLTPVTTTVTLKEDDRVLVSISDHTATVTGNISDVSAGSSDVEEVSGKLTEAVTEFYSIVSDKATIEELDAQKARIDTLYADHVSIENLEAESAKIEALEVENANITEKLTAVEADVDNLHATTLTADVAAVTYATIENLEATNADIYNLESTYAEFEVATVKKLEAVDADIENLEADKLDAAAADIKFATIDSLKATDANIDTLEAEFAEFETATADNFVAVNADISNLEATKLTVDQANLAYAQIDFANIGDAAVEKLFSESGIISDLVMSDGAVTGKLVGVTIIGDLIEGGTVKADKLVIQGEDGLYYKLNTTGESVTAEQTEYNSLNGSIITAQSITAEKINVDDLVAFDATIGGFNITESAIYSGTKSSVSSGNTGIYLDKDGQLSVGDSNNYLKYYKDTDNTYKLVISASSVKMVSSNKTLEEELQEIRDEVTCNLRIESSRGTVFKNDNVSTVLSAVIYRGSERITDITTLRAAMGSGAYLQWKWQRLDEETFGVISTSDTRLGNNGFTFTLSPEDVDTKVTFMCELIV